MDSDTGRARQVRYDEDMEVDSGDDEHRSSPPVDVGEDSGQDREDAHPDGPACRGQTIGYWEPLGEVFSHGYDRPDWEEGVTDSCR